MGLVFVYRTSTVRSDTNSNDTWTQIAGIFGDPKGLGSASLMTWCYEDFERPGRAVQSSIVTAPVFLKTADARFIEFYGHFALYLL